MENASEKPDLKASIERLNSSVIKGSELVAKSRQLEAHLEVVQRMLVFWTTLLSILPPPVKNDAQRHKMGTKGEFKIVDEMSNGFFVSPTQVVVKGTVIVNWFQALKATKYGWKIVNVDKRGLATVRKE